MCGHFLFSLRLFSTSQEAQLDVHICSSSTQRPRQRDLSYSEASHGWGHWAVARTRPVPKMYKALGSIANTAEKVVSQCALQFRVVTQTVCFKLMI